MSWWIDLSRDGFTKAGEAHTFGDVDGLSRKVKPKGIAIQTGAFAKTPRQRVHVSRAKHPGIGTGKYPRPAKVQKTHCATCAKPLTAYRQVRGFARCYTCCKATPGRMRKAS